MSGLEVFGAVGTAISLIQMTRSKLSRARRVGRNIDDLRAHLSDLLELQRDVDPVRDADLLGRIERNVAEATELLQENLQTGTAPSLRFLWTHGLDGDVETISRNVANIYMVLDRRVKQRDRSRDSSRGSTGDDNIHPDISSSTSGSPRLDSKSSWRTGSQEFGYSARRPSSNRPPSMNTITLPSNLTLYDADHEIVRRRIPLERFCVLEREEGATSRTILYESTDLSVAVTHEIRFGTIPSTPDVLDAREVSFLESHIITLETDDEYAIYKVEPLYEFSDAATCKNFMARVRQRTLLATFLPREIHRCSVPQKSSRSSLLDVLSLGPGGITLSRWKIVRLWHRDTPIGPLVTMTFHDRSKSPPTFTEWSLSDFRDAAIILKNGRLVELSRYRRNEQFNFVFECKLRTLLMHGKTAANSEQRKTKLGSSKTHMKKVGQTEEVVNT